MVDIRRNYPGKKEILHKIIFFRLRASILEFIININLNIIMIYNEGAILIKGFYPSQYYLYNENFEPVAVEGLYPSDLYVYSLHGGHFLFGQYPALADEYGRFFVTWAFYEEGGTLRKKKNK